MNSTRLWESPDAAAAEYPPLQSTAAAASSISTGVAVGDCGTQPDRDSSLRDSTRGTIKLFGKHMKRCLRFSIATLLLLTTIIAAYFGGYRSGYKAAEAEIQALELVVPQFTRSATSGSAPTTP